MKKLITISLLLLSMYSFCQTDYHDNPVFNSFSTGEDTIGNFKLVSNYYTLKNNIEYRTSSVYISDNPTLDEISDAATRLPSDFFMILKGQSLINMILVVNYPTRKIVVINSETRQQKEYSCSLKGDITENRASEIVKEKYDSHSAIRNGKLVEKSVIYVTFARKYIRFLREYVLIFV